MIPGQETSFKEIIKFVIQINRHTQWRAGYLTKRRVLDLFLQILNEAER